MLVETSAQNISNQLLRLVFSFLELRSWRERAGRNLNQLTFIG